MGPKESDVMIQSNRLFSLLFLLFLAISLAGCGNKEAKTKAPVSYAMDEAEHERWEIALVEMRIEKNEEFRDPKRTPLSEEGLKTFEDLNYFFPYPEMRFRTRFEANAGVDTVGLTKRKGQVVSYLRRGYVEFSWQDKEYSLAVFGPVDTTGGDYLWLPFFDKNSGQEVYAGGRYLDINIDQDGMVDLDFNFAYNPLCDYNPDRYNCTIPPVENSLPFAVNAGEKAFSKGH